MVLKLTKNQVLRYDPTRTTLIRRSYLAETNRRLNAVKRAVRGYEIVSLDDFSTWIEEQFAANVLTSDLFAANGWVEKYIDRSYKKGIRRSIAEMRKKTTEILDQNLISRQIGVQSKVNLLSKRAFEELKGVSAAMIQQMNRIAADGISAGTSSTAMHREMLKTITKLSNTRAKVAARTETVRSHAEGQLDTFEIIGVGKIELLAELATAGDNKVCVECQELEGEVFTIKEARGIIPVHPNCRCAWLPVI